MVIMRPEPEHTRQEHFSDYAHLLTERFAAGTLAELQPLPQWVVWRAELEDGKHNVTRTQSLGVFIPRSRNMLIPQGH
jgi:hypothetical protein